jgi:hypothetical protein
LNGVRETAGDAAGARQRDSGSSGREAVVMLMRVVVPIITALIMIMVGAFEIFLMLPGMNVYGDSTWTTILIANSVLVIIIILIASVVSGLLAHVIQKRSGISPWVVGPLTIVAVTAVAIVAMSLGVSILTTIIGAARHSPAPPARQPTPVNRRGGGAINR